MRTEVKAVVGTNAWGDALYGKMLRGSYVEEDGSGRLCRPKKSGSRLSKIMMRILRIW